VVQLALAIPISSNKPSTQHCIEIKSKKLLTTFKQTQESMSVEYFPFRPALDGPFAKRFYERIKYLAEA
jgi:hypothetical protein